MFTFIHVTHTLLLAGRAQFLIIGFIQTIYTSMIIGKYHNQRDTKEWGNITPTILRQSIVQSSEFTNGLSMRNVVSGSGEKPTADQVDYSQNAPMPLPKHPEATQIQEHHVLTLQFTAQWVTYHLHCNPIYPHPASLCIPGNSLNLRLHWDFKYHDNNPESFLPFSVSFGG